MTQISQIDLAGGKKELAALLHQEITKEIIGSAFEVYNQLGYGYLEKIYQRAMQVELLRRDLPCELEHPITVRYKEVIVGEYQADLLVGEKVIVELKVAPSYSCSDEAQLINELKSTGIRVGLLINFGRSKVEFKRVVF